VDSRDDESQPPPFRADVTAEAADAEPDDDAATAGAAVAKLTLWRRFRSARLSLPYVCGVAVVGPATAGGIAALNEPGRSWVHYMLVAAGGGWVAPLLMAVLLAVATTRNDKRVLSSSALLVSLMAARTNAYMKAGLPDPVRAAAIDVANAMAGRTWTGLAGRWTLDAIAWHGSLPRSDGLPTLPASLRNLAKEQPPE
jgi:hypothetical protein